MKITIISPNIVSQKGDVAGTGIPYMPVSLVYLATYLKNIGHEIQFIDSFSEDPFKITEHDEYLYQGLTPKEINYRIHSDVELIILYAAQVYAHDSVISIFKEIQKREKPILIIENTQAVTAYSLQHAYKEFIDIGVDYILSGEAEPRIGKFIDFLKGKAKIESVDGLIYLDSKTHKVKINNKIVTQDFEKLPFPDWSLLKLENYWKLGYAHAPLTTGKYLPLITSRGCPFHCAFCVVFSTNNGKWRPRSAESVVNEIEYNVKKYHVKEFHIEDLNPTIIKERIIEISKLLIKRNIHVLLKFSAGTKAETYDLETIEWMAKGGFNYISISPESGSPHVLKLMNKYFNHKLAIQQIKKMHELKITSQACFVLGFPGETDHDLKLTSQYIAKLARAGLDEVALFIMTPVPGSKIYEETTPTDLKLSKLTFTPKWRKGYARLIHWRIKLFIIFIINKFLFHPIKTVSMICNLLSHRFKTKIEMTAYRIIKTQLLFKKSKK